LYGFAILLISIMVLPGIGSSEDSTSTTELPNVNLYVQIDGVPGDSQAAGHIDWIDAKAYADGIYSDASASAVSGGRSGGRAAIAPVKLFKALDSASPILRQRAALGSFIQDVVIHAVTASDSRLLWEVHLEGVLVTNLTTVLSSNSSEEEVDLSYGKISWIYFLPGGNGSPGKSVKGCWDLQANKSC
jgi:type VI secretion system Hcp family effector